MLQIVRYTEDIFKNLIVDTVSQNDQMLDYKSPILPELAKNVVTADFIET